MANEALLTPVGIPLDPGVSRTVRRLRLTTLRGVLAFFVVNIGARLASATAAGTALWKTLQ
jgi:hypothetical protein